MKKHLFRLLLLPCLLTAHPTLGQNDAPARPDSVQTEIEIQALTARLEAAYRQLFPNDTPYHRPGSYSDPEMFHSPLLDDFLEEWHRRYAPTEAADRQRSDTLATVYDLFAEFSRPDMKIMIWRDGKSQTLGLYRYVTITEKFPYAVLDDETFEQLLQTGKFHKVRYTTLAPFRPDIPYSRSLYMSYVYACALDRFLGNRECATDREDLIPRLEEGEYWRRGDFIYNSLPILGGHWGGWLYEAEPRCFSILLNASLDRAIIHAGYSSSGTEGLYRKADGKWTRERELSQWMQ